MTYARRCDKVFLSKGDVVTKKAMSQEAAARKRFIESHIFLTYVDPSGGGRVQLSFKGSPLFYDEAYEFYNLLNSFGMKTVWICSSNRSKALRMVDAWFEGSIKWATCDLTRLDGKCEKPEAVKEKIEKALASLRQMESYIPKIKSWHYLQEHIEGVKNAIDKMNSISIEVCVDGVVTLYDELYIICLSNS